MDMPDSSPTSAQPMKRALVDYGLVFVVVSIVLVFVAGPSALERFRDDGPQSVQDWMSEIRRNVPGPNVGQQVEDPALVRTLRDVVATSGPVAVEVAVFDAGA
jgi:hypothetical protein